MVRSLLSAISAAVQVVVWGLMLGSAQAQDPVRIDAFEINKLVEPGGTGYYLDLLAALEFGEDWALDLSVVPVLRAAKNFEAKRTDCMFPTSELTFETGSASPENTVFSNPVNHIRILAYVMHGNRPLVDSSDLAGKRVAFRHGFHLPEDVERMAAQFERVPSLQSGYQMLRTGRVDVLLAYVPDFLIFAAENGVTDVVTNEAFHLHPQGEMILCHKTEKTLRFLKAFNSALAHSKSMGTHGSILGPSLVKPVPIGGQGRNLAADQVDKAAE